MVPTLLMGSWHSICLRSLFTTRAQVFFEMFCRVQSFTAGIRDKRGQEWIEMLSDVSCVIICEVPSFSSLLRRKVRRISYPDITDTNQIQYTPPGGVTITAFVLGLDLFEIQLSVVTSTQVLIQAWPQEGLWPDAWHSHRRCLAYSGPCTLGYYLCVCVLTNYPFKGCTESNITLFSFACYVSLLLPKPYHFPLFLSVWKSIWNL